MVDVPVVGPGPRADLVQVHRVDPHPLRDQRLVGLHRLRDQRLVGLHPLPNQQQDHGPLRAVIFEKIFPQSRQEIYRARPARLQQVAFPGKGLGR